MDDENKKTDTGSGAPTDARDALTTERDEYLNGWKRAKADLINYKKEETRRFQEMAAFATLGFVREMLAGMDSFDLALSSTKDEEMKKGVLMIRGQFEEILKRQGVARIAVKPGDPPDPKLHEAINEVALTPEQKHLEGKIIAELSAGYMMGERVIRASKVSIGTLSA